MESFFKGLFIRTVTGSHSDSGFTNSGLRPSTKYTCPADRWAIAILDSAGVTQPAGQGLSMNIYNNNLPHLKSRFYSAAASASTSIQQPNQVLLRPGDSLIAVYQNDSNVSLPCTGTCTFIIFEFSNSAGA